MDKSRGTKIIRVLNCTNCPYRRTYLWYPYDDWKGGSQYCANSTTTLTVKNRELPHLGTRERNNLPDWCPLEDIEK